MSKSSSKTFDHDALVIPSVNDTWEIIFDQPGTDDVAGPAYISYYDLQRPAKAIAVKADKIAQITHVNGVELKSPINIAANGIDSQNINAYQEHKFRSIKIKCLNDTTNVEVRGSC